MALAFCAPPVDREVAFRRSLPPLEYEEVHDDFGQYAFRYITAEGTVVSQRAWLVPTENETYVLVSEGETSYIGDDGELYVTKFFAGINGTNIETNHYPITSEDTNAEEETQPEEDKIQEDAPQ